MTKDEQHNQRDGIHKPLAHLLIVIDWILDLMISGIPGMWVAAAAILVVVSVVILATTLRSYWTIGEYLLSSGSISRWSFK
jgi:hypothetical protein